MIDTNALPPVVRISATYHATDGSVPEEIAVEIPTQGLDTDQLGRLIERVIGDLTRVPAERPLRTVVR